ncbi:MAG: ABC transporter substrate-binding protein, partial [Kangiellaceae bacterium]|nr:ABC transporter substrate-binding protein [Kangiellaceae bacterium]
CQYQQNTKVKEDVLVYCTEGSPQTFNPQLSTSGTTFDASSRTLYNRLVEFQPGTTYIQPALAQSWEVSSDGKTYTFDLRRDVKFHNNSDFQPSRNFNADDVIFSFERQWDKKHPYHDVSNLSYRYFEAMQLGSLIKNIEKISDYKVRFELTRAESPFLATMAMDFASILSAEYAQQLVSQGQPEKLDTNPIGTGPFQLVRYQPDAYIRYKAHPDYWQEKQRLENLVFAITPDPSLRFARVVAGECDVMANPLPVHIKASNEFSYTKVLQSPGLNIAYLSMNTQKPPFDNDKVRLALNYAINKDAIIQAVYRGTASKAKNPIPPNMWSYDQDTSDFGYEPRKAKQLLEEAGYANGFDMTVWTMSAQRAYNPNAKKMAELIQQDLKDIGIRLKIETFEYGSFLNKVREGRHHSALLGWISDNGDPDNFFTPLLSCAGTLSGTNSSNWCNQEFNRLIEKARSQNQLKNRARQYKKAQAIFKQQSPWVPIAHATQHVIINPRVKNFKITPSGGVYFEGVYLDEEFYRD